MFPNSFLNLVLSLLPPSCSVLPSHQLPPQSKLPQFSHPPLHSTCSLLSFPLKLFPCPLPWPLPTLLTNSSLLSTPQPRHRLIRYHHSVSALWLNPRAVRLGWGRGQRIHPPLLQLSLEQSLGYNGTLLKPAVTDGSGNAGPPQLS